MSDNKRNIDTDAIAHSSQGNSSATGTGTHAVNARESAADQSDNKAKGNEARVSGYGKGMTQPETGKN